MKKVPFYANHEDNMHCAVAVYRMLFDYFMGRHIGWENIDKMSGFKPGKAAWTVTMWERMSRQGFDIQLIEPFDYQRYEKEGERYLHAAMSPEKYDWCVKNSNILEIRKLIPSFLKEVHVENRRASLGDIDRFLDEGRLVFVTLNANVLADKEGFSLHAVLVIDREDEDFIVHDPGGKPQPYRRLSREKLWQAMGGEHHSAEVSGIKYQPRQQRADVILANMYPTYSRAALAKLFKAGVVTYREKVLKPGDKLLSNVELQADMSSLRVPEPSDIDLPVIFEDEDVLVINKPAGVLTHAQGETVTEASVATFIRQRTADMSGERAGIVHRLDRATSGVLVCAKNPKTLSALQQQFAKREVKKTYIAIVEGHLKQKEAIIDMPLERNPKAPATFRVGANGKPSTTHYKVIEENEHASLVELTPQTGRTHQLRVHLAHLGHPIIGDVLYHNGKFGERMYLHALSLELDLPVSHEHKIFTAPLPKEFMEYMAK